MELIEIIEKLTDKIIELRKERAEQENLINELWRGNETLPKD